MQGEEMGNNERVKLFVWKKTCFVFLHLKRINLASAFHCHRKNHSHVHVQAPLPFCENVDNNGIPLKRVVLPAAYFPLQPSSHKMESEEDLSYTGFDRGSMGT